MYEYTKKHAYLIMVHHRPDLLRTLLDALDDERNDIYIHIDKKSTDIFDVSCSYSKVMLVEPMSVNWGGYSQIECTLRLIDAAVSDGHHIYYHLLTGATFPLKDQDTIHKFFMDSHYEYIGFDYSDDYSDRVLYKWLFPEYGKTNNVLGKFVKAVRKMYILWQKRTAKCNERRYKKGQVYWSITEEFANYLLEKRESIEKEYKYSNCADEIFVQDTIYNSYYKDNIYDINDEKRGALREIAWDDLYEEGLVDESHNFNMKAVPMLLQSENMFALKFENLDGMKIIEEIKKSWS